MFTLSATQTDVFQELRAFSTCDIADCLQKLGLKHGGFLEDIRMFSPQQQSGATRIAGPARTVRFTPIEDLEDVPKMVSHYIDETHEGDILFLSQPLPHINACYGGLVSLRAKTLGAKGVVIDGRFRDLQDQRDLEFPVFARSVGTTAGHAVCYPSAMDTPVRFHSAVQDITISPGDCIVADIDGVVANEAIFKCIKEGAEAGPAFRKFKGK